MSNKYTQIDQFICETGLIDIKNLFAGKSVLINKIKTAISNMNGMLEIKDNQFIKIPIEKISVLNKVELKNIKEIGKGDKIFLRIIKYSSLIGAGLIIYSLDSL